MTGVPGVNLRTKKKRVVGSEDSQDGFDEPERPMSWEGELSDAEMSIVTGACLSSKQVCTDKFDKIHSSLLKYFIFHIHFSTFFFPRPTSGC
jgi:hypothetical protein